MTDKNFRVFKYLGLQISLKNGLVLKTDLWMSSFKWDWPQPWELFIFWQIKQKAWLNLLKCSKRLLQFFCLVGFWFAWLGSVSFETWYPNVRFEYWTIFEGYLRAEIFKNELWTFCQSLNCHNPNSTSTQPNLTTKSWVWSDYDFAPPPTL